MAVKVMIPTALRAYADGTDTVELEGGDVAAVLDALCTQHPDLKPHMFNDDGSLRNFVNVYRNAEDIRHLSDTQTPVNDGDELTIVPAIAGG